MLFLAGGLAFNVLLALVPFVLLLISGLALLLGNEPERAAITVTGLLQSLLPANSPSATELVQNAINDVLRTRGSVGVYSAVSFAWFSTRLFGSLRSCLSMVFDGEDHGIVKGKLFDFAVTFIATVAVVVYVVFSAYLDLATTRGVAILVHVGLRESAMSSVAYVFGRMLSIVVVFALFYSLYRGLPRWRPTPKTALIGATAAAILFEIARNVFAILVRHFDPGSLYTGTIAAIVAVVFWTYYGALLFLIGGEVGQAFALRGAAAMSVARSVAPPVLTRKSKS